MSTFLVIAVKAEYSSNAKSALSKYFDINGANNKSLQQYLGSAWNSFYVTMNGTSEKIVLFEKMAVHKSSSTHKEIRQNFSELINSLEELVSSSYSAKMICFNASADQDEEIIFVKSKRKVLFNPTEGLQLNFMEYNLLYHFVIS